MRAMLTTTTTLTSVAFAELVLIHQNRIKEYKAGWDSSMTELPIPQRHRASSFARIASPRETIRMTFAAAAQAV
jgi:hypothetical protein